MRALKFALGLTWAGTVGCAASSLPQLGAPEDARASRGGQQPSLPDFPTTTGVAAREPEPAPRAVKEYGGLERQLHLIADRQLDVSRDEVEELFAELRARRMLLETAVDAATRELERRRDTQTQDEAGSDPKP